MTEELDFRKAVPQSRRDLRPGKQTAQCRLLPKGLYVEMSWGEPLAGRLTETYHIEQDTLYVESSINVEDGSAATVVVSLPPPCFMIRPQFGYGVCFMPDDVRLHSFCTALPMAF